jgi:uncharacterized protein involved in exopolysaccharide biosynthesis
MSASQRIDFRFVTGALWRFRRRALCFAVACFSLVLAGLILAPREYSSEARLFLRLGHVALDPTSTLGDKLTLNDTPQNEINSALEMLRSTELCQRVVDRLGPDLILDPPSPGSDQVAEAAADAGPSTLSQGWTSLVKGLEGVGLLDPLDRRERAVIALSQAMQASVPRNTYLVAVSCRSNTPENAQRITETIIECFSEMHLQAHRTIQSHEFFVEQSDQLKERIRRDSENLSQRKNELGFVTLQGQRTLLENERANIEQQLTITTGQLAASRAKLKSLQVSVKELPAHEVTAKVDVPNQAADNMRQLLYQLEIQERESASKLGENHPKLTSIRQQLKDVKAILAEQAESRLQTTTAVSPTQQPLQLALLMEKSEAESLEAKVNTLRSDSERIAASMQKFNEQLVEIERLERDLALADADYRAYATRREQSRIDRALAADQISNLNVVQRATLVRKPASPKKVPTLAAGLAASVLGAVCLAIVSARFDRSFHSAEELEANLSVPVLLTVPEFEAANRPRSLAELEEASDHATA